VIKLSPLIVHLKLTSNKFVTKKRGQHVLFLIFFPENNFQEIGKEFFFLILFPLKIIETCYNKNMLKNQKNMND
jgi:hypothetical protein